ncbi:TfuA-like protein [Mesorhizobium sp. IMUNJ 23033]|uniref:TfuA-like protein n=1 Tax=Mesorhizobium sp. IMUNJ 23033 TaxID=3378039 RepID=UPI00384F6515
MKPVLFVGPTLRSVPKGASFDWRPPAQRGDIYRAAAAGARMIGLIDGCFRTVPSVLHKEILWALNGGCAVFGAASMGAIRAAELYPCGMIGIGAIFHDFVSGRITRDDEVAIEHGPAELGFPQTSEALINIRYTLREAVALNKIATRAAREIEEIASATYYARRNLANAIDAYNVRCAPDGRINTEVTNWFSQNRVDQKKRDALELLAAMNQYLETGQLPKNQLFEFEETIFFAEFRAAMDNPIIRDFT